MFHIKNLRFISLIIFALIFGVNSFAVTTRPVSAQTPHLILSKVIDVADEEAVRPGDRVTYTISLRYQGDTNPVRASLRDVLPNGVTPIGRPSISEATDKTVTPLILKRQGRTIGWQGQIRPKGELIIKIPVYVDECWGGGRLIPNEAVAQGPNGELIRASADLRVRCVETTIRDIHVRQQVVQPGDSHYGFAAFLPGQSAIVRTSVRNTGLEPVVVGVTPLSVESAQVEAYAAAANNAIIGGNSGDQLTRIPLGPGDARSVEHRLQLNENITSDMLLDGQVRLTSELTYCLLSEEARTCPTPATDSVSAAQVSLCFTPRIYAAGQTSFADDGDCPPDPDSDPPQTDPITQTIPVRPYDLGDAPDSSNHIGMSMEAYPGVLARYPTVFVPAPGSPHGPLHRHPGPLHLGPQVSVEAEADIGPDADPTNNILPAINIPNRDRFDDAVRFDRIALKHCSPISIRTRVGLASAAAKQKLLNRGVETVYLNIWVDGTRDGDWGDVAPCPSSGPMAHEHVLIDYPLSVAALSPGINIFNIVGTVPALYPEKFNDQTAWMRLTLSEIPSPKLSGRNYGDGRGPATGYRLGETEDYRLPAPDSASKSDIVIEHDGHFDPHYELPTVVWDIIYRNEGLTTARNVDIIHKLLDVSDARLVEVRAPGLSGNQIRPDKNQILFNIGDVAPGEWGRFIIKWQVPLGLSTVSATVTATSDNEGNPSNNEATATATIVEAPLHFGFRTADDLPLSCRGTTCQNRVDLIGKGQPGATIYILHAPVRRQADRTAEYQVVGKTQVATNGTWSYVIAELNAGVNLVGANYSGEGQPLAIVTIRYDAELPFDPNSFRVEHKEQSLQPDTFGHTWDALQIPNSFDEVTLGMNACGKQSDILFTYGDQAGQSVLLTDEDQDGRFEGQLKLMNGLTVASVQESLNFTLSTTNGTVETSFDGAIERLSTGVVRNRTNNAPVKNATVTLFENHSGRNADGSIDPSTLTMVQLDQEYGQVNPQTTDENGTFVLSAPSGLMQLTVTLDGYQPYRTSAFETDSGLIDASLPQSQILLTPVVTEQTTHFVQLSNAGFEPATLAVLPGSIVEFINIDSAMHSVQGKFGDSGLLAIGESYKVRFVDEGTFSYRDGENPLHLGTISVDADTPAPTDEPDETNDGQVFLPLVLR